MFDRPIIILSAPRSGSTLLFEILGNAPGLFTIGDESHAVIESLPELRVSSDNISNYLEKSHATESVIKRLRENFYSRLRDRDGVKPTPGNSVRFLEKTPKNSLRASFLNAVFPDCYFIYLVRDPCENISSMMEAWRSGGWVTYEGLPGWNVNWSLLLPPQWHAAKGKPLEQIVAFQWAASNNHIMFELNKLPACRWAAISYKQLVSDTENQIRRLCSLCMLEFDDKLLQLTRNTLPYSKYTLSQPDSAKWKNNQKEISSVLPMLAGTIGSIDKMIHNDSSGNCDWIVNHIPDYQENNNSCP